MKQSYFQKYILPLAFWRGGRGGRSYLLFFTLLLAAVPVGSHAQTCAPTATFYYTTTDDNGVGTETSEEAESYSGSGPVRGVFAANPEGADAFEARYEWKIYESATPTTILVHRFEENLEYTFEKSGSFTVELSATFVQGNDTVYYPEEGEEATRFTVSIAESKLEMPNAFSPNGDGYNDVYKAKDTFQSIVSFKATVFNRWGQKLYSWDDIRGGWDGTYNGKTVKDGVYFVNVVAKGADGHVYHIRKDVNVLTRTNENASSSSSTE